MTHILIYHESPILSQQISHVLHGEPDFEVICQSDSLDIVLAHLQKSQGDILLASYTLPKATISQLMESVCQLAWPGKVMLMGLPNEEEIILECLEDGAHGYLCQQEGMADLVKKIRSLTEDEFILDPNIGASLMERISQLQQLVNELDGGHIARPQERYAELTQREVEVLRLLGQDCSNQEIAEQLTIELGTVKNHVHNLLRKLDVCSRKQAAQLAQQLFGHVTTDERIHYTDLFPVYDKVGMGQAQRRQLAGIRE